MAITKIDFKSRMAVFDNECELVWIDSKGEQHCVGELDFDNPIPDFEPPELLMTLNERQEQIQYLIKYLEDNPDRIVGLPSGERVPAKVALSLLQCGVLGAVARDLYKPTDKQVDTSYQSMKNFVDKNCNEQ